MPHGKTNNKNERLDLLLKCAGGRIFNSATGKFSGDDIGIRGGKVVQISKDIPIGDERQLFLIGPGMTVTSGGKDPHVHIVPGCPWSQGIRPEQHCMHLGGTPLIVDAGSVGRNAFDDAYRFVMVRPPVDDLPRTRILAGLNIVDGGLANEHHECFDLQYLRPDETAEFARRYKGVIPFIKVRLGWLQAAAHTWKEALRRSIQAADAAGLPVMVHINDGPRLDKILEMLRPGDIVTHCFHGRSANKGCTILGKGRKLRPSVRNAVLAGVYLDLGHGQGGYDHMVADDAIRDKLLTLAPEQITLSTDLHRGCINGPTYNFARLMTKAATWSGVDLGTIYRMVTWNAGKMLGLTSRFGRRSRRPETILSVTLTVLSGWRRRLSKPLTSSAPVS